MAGPKYRSLRIRSIIAHWCTAKFKAYPHDAVKTKFFISVGIVWFLHTGLLGHVPENESSAHRWKISPDLLVNSSRHNCICHDTTFAEHSTVYYSFLMVYKLCRQEFSNLKIYTWCLFYTEIMNNTNLLI